MDPAGAIVSEDAGSRISGDMTMVKLPGIVVQDVGDAEITPGVNMRDFVGQPAPREELDDLIVEREWFDKEFPQRVAAMVRHHRQRHGKEPQRIFLPTRFVDWIHKRWGRNLNFEVPTGHIEIPLMPTDQAPTDQAVIELVNMEVVRAIRLEAAFDTIRLDTVLISSEASIRCGHCRGEFSFLATERWTRVGCQHCGKILLIEWNSSTGETTVYPEEENKP